MGDEIHPVTVGSGTEVVSDARVRIGNAESGELAMPLGCQNEMMVLQLGYFSVASDAMHFSATLSDWRNKVMFDPRSTQRDRDIGALEQRRNAISS